MIFLLILLDIIVNNFTQYTSYFFINYLYNKPFKFYLLTALILDFLVFNTLFYNLIALTAIYIFNKIFKWLNKNNFYNYIYICTFNYIMFIAITNALSFNNIPHILITIGQNLVLNIIFYSLTYRPQKICYTK